MGRETGEARDDDARDDDARDDDAREEDALDRARSRIDALEVELERARLGIADLEGQIERARVNDADLKAQLDRARANDADLKAQLERARSGSEDLVRQLEASRIERLHLTERLQSLARPPHGWLPRWLAGATTEQPVPSHMVRARRRVARRHLRGRGLEIGALHSPIPVGRGVAVRYVDRLPTEALRREYPEWSNVDMVEVDVVDDGERLETIPDGSQDFLIASHMLEHCENPLGTMRIHLAKLRPGGVLFYVVPDRRGSFDAERPLTSFEHLVRDDREGPEGSRWEHYLEFSRLANKSPEDQVETIARRMLEARANIHFHVWEDSSFREFLERAADHLQTPLRVEHFELNHAEIIAVLRRSADPADAGKAQEPGAPGRDSP